MNYHFVCFHWGELYPTHNIERLYRSVKAQFSFPFQFHCLSQHKLELSDGIQNHDLQYGQPFFGNWNKLKVFQKDFLGLNKNDFIIVFDLDILITGNLDFLVQDSPEEDIIFAADGYRKRIGKCHGSVYRLRANTHTYVYDKLINSDLEQIKEELGGEREQDWLDQFFPPDNVKLFDIDKIVSYKYHCSAEAFAPLGKTYAKYGLTTSHWGSAKLPTNARIVAFHGKPDMEDVCDKRWGKWRKAPFIYDYQYESE